MIIMVASTKSPAKIDRLHQFLSQTKDNFIKTHTDADDWLKKKAVSVEDFRNKSQQILAATSLAGTVAMNNLPVDMQVKQNLLQVEKKQKSDLLAQVSVEEWQAVMDKLRGIVQMPPGHMEAEDELYIERQLSDMLGFTVTAELEGHRLNHSIGIMGGEQHLYRFPTDSLSSHDNYQEAGIAPNRGAFGWFTENGELTETAILREKYYFAVQTLYLSDWNTNYQELKPWYKFRKMVVINPMDQVAVVGVVGDAGPAEWVQKQFGGSPEIIREGKIWSSQADGKILLLFVDDPEDQVPLGPIDLSTMGQMLADAGAQLEEANE